MEKITVTPDDWQSYCAENAEASYNCSPEKATLFAHFIATKYSKKSICTPITQSQDFMYERLTGLNFSCCEFFKCTFRHISDSNFSHAKFVDCNFYTADASRSNFRGATFSNCNLTDINFTKANLVDATFRDSNLITCDLRGANLDGIVLLGQCMVGGVVGDSLLLEGELENIQSQQQIVEQQRKEKESALAEDMQHSQLTVLADFLHQLQSTQQSGVNELEKALSNLVHQVEIQDTASLTCIQQIHMYQDIIKIVKDSMLTNVLDTLETQSKSLQNPMPIQAWAAQDEDETIVKKLEATLTELKSDMPLLDVTSLTKLIAPLRQQAHINLAEKIFDILASQLKELQSYSLDDVVMGYNMLQADTVDSFIQSANTLAATLKNQWEDWSARFETQKAVFMKQLLFTLRNMEIHQSYYALLKEIDEQIGENYRQYQNEGRPVSCFISYSWGDPINERRVHTIAADLKQAGIGMLLDIWDNKPGTSISRFTHETQTCDVVLLSGTRRLFFRWSRREGVVSQEIPQIIAREFPPDDRPKRKVIPLLLNGLSAEELLPSEVLPLEMVDLRESYNTQIFHLLGMLYKVQPDSPEEQLIRSAQTRFREFTDSVFSKPLESAVLDLGYVGTDQSKMIEVAKKEIDRFEARKAARKKELESILPVLLSKLFDRYNTRQKSNVPKYPAFGVEQENAEEESPTQPLSNIIKNFVSSQDKSAHLVLLLKETQDSMGSGNAVEKLLWAFYQADPEHMPVPILLDFFQMTKDFEFDSHMESSSSTLDYVFKQLGYSTDEISRLKANYRPVFVFSSLESLRNLSHAPYIDNHLEQWQDAKVIVTISESFLKEQSQGGSYQTVFSAGKQYASLKLAEGRLVPWTAQQSALFASQEQGSQKAEEPLTGSSLSSREVEHLRDIALSEAFSKTLKNIKQRLGSKSPRVFISFAKDDSAFIPLISRLSAHLYQAGIKVLVDIRPPYEPEKASEPKIINYNCYEFYEEEKELPAPTDQKHSRFFHEMEDCDIVVMGASQKFLQHFEQNIPQVSSEMEVIVKRSQAPRKGYSSPVLPIVLQGPADPKQFPVMVIPPMLRDYVYVDFRDPRQYYSSVMIVLCSLYQASIFTEVKTCMDQQELDFKNQVEQIKKLEAVPLMMQLGHSSPTKSQLLQRFARHKEYLHQQDHLVENLVPALFDPLYVAHQKRLQQPELTQGLAYYVPVEAQPVPASSDRHDLLEHYIKPFLGLSNNAGHTPNQVLLVQGESGSGKSLALHNLEKVLWETYLLDPVHNPVPVLIELKSIESTVPTEFVKYHLQTVLGLSESAVEAMQTRYKLVFLFDAYDEQPGTPRKLFLDNELGKWKDAKAVVTVRPSYISSLSGYQQILGSFSSSGEIVPPSECFVSSFSLKQIGSFLSKYVADPRNNVVGWGLQRYHDTLASLPSLREVVTSPLLLRMVISVLPQIAKKTRQEATPKPVTRAEIYRLFIQQWFEREDVRLLELGSRPKDFDAHSSFGDFAENFAFFLFQNGMVEIDVKSLSQTGMSKEWQEYFLSQDPVIMQKRAGCPLRQVDHRYSFYHKSFLEYFAMMHIFQALKLSDDAQFKKVLDDIAMSPLNSRSLMADNTGEAIATFLADKVVGEPARIQRLLDVVKASKTSETVAIASSNAITVLNLARVSFAKLDLAGVKIPMANLSRSLLVGTNLEGADLTKVRLQDALLADANLSKANLTSIALGALPEVVNCQAHKLAVSRDGKWFGVAKGDTVEVLEMDTLVVSITFPTHYPCYFFFTKDSAAIAFGREKENIAIKLIATGEDSSDYASDIEEFFSYNLTIGTPGLWNCQPVLISPDKRFRATILPNDSKNISIQDPNSDLEYDSQVLHTLTGHTDQVTQLQYSPNGKFLVSWCTTTGFYVCTDNTLRIWDVEGGVLVGTVAESKEFKDVKFSADGKLLIYATQEDVIQFLDFAQIVSTKKNAGHSSSIERMVLRKKYLISAGLDSLSCIWNVETGQLLHTLARHDWWVGRVDTSPDGKLVATGSPVSSTNGFGGQADRFVKIWDTATGAMLGTLSHNDGIQDLHWSPTGRHIATAGSYQDRVVRLWDAQVADWKQEPATLHTWHFNELLTSLQFSLDGKYLVVVTQEKLVIYDVLSGAEHYSHFVGQQHYLLCTNEKKENILIYTLNTSIAVFNINTKETTQFDVNSDIREIHSTEHFGTIAFANLENVQLWDATQGTLLHSIPLEQVQQVHLNANATLVAAQVADAVKVFEVQSGKMLESLPVFKVTRFLFVHDDIVCASDSNVITFWQTKDKQSWKIEWTSNPRLRALNCNLNRATGLTMTQVTLFTQRGAVGYPAISAQSVASLGWTPGHLAVANGDFEKLKQLIESGSQSVNDVAKDGSSLLHFAAMFQNIDMICYLLDKDADFEIKNRNNKTARELAQDLGKTEAVQNLPGRDTYLKAFHLAVSDGLEKIVKFLLAKGYNIEERDEDAYPQGATPLQIAAVRNRVQMGKILIDAGADVNTRTADGRTPLIQAAANGYNDIVQLLLDTGKVDIEAVDNEGKSALAMAMQYNIQSTIDLLVSKGAKIPDATFHFVIPYQTQMGEELFLVGSIPELGNWNFADSKTKLTWSEGHVWKTSLRVSQNMLPVEYKYVVFNSNSNQTTWEPVEGNRVCKAGSIETTMQDHWGQLH